jgi:hypothetical protein
MATAPLLVAVWIAATDDAHGFIDALISAYSVGMLMWALPASLIGALAWPSVWSVLSLTLPFAPLPRAVRRVLFGGAAGAAVGAPLGLVSIFLLGPFGAFWFAVWGAAIGAATGLIWSGWFVALDALAPAKPPPKS